MRDCGFKQVTKNFAINYSLVIDRPRVTLKKTSKSDEFPNKFFIVRFSSQTEKAATAFKNHSKAKGLYYNTFTAIIFVVL